MTRTLKPFASQKTLKVKVKEIQDEIKTTVAVIKLCEQESEKVQFSIDSQHEENEKLESMFDCDCTEHPFSDSEPAGFTHQCICPKDCNCASRTALDPDLQMLMWELEDNVGLAATLKRELADRASQGKARTEELEKELQETFDRLRYFSVQSRLARLVNNFAPARTISDDYSACAGAIKDFWLGYVGGGLTALAIATGFLTVLCSLSGSCAIALAPAVIISLFCLLTMFEIENESKRPKSKSLRLAAATFPLLFRVAPAMLIGICVSVATVPGEASKRAVENYLKHTYNPVASYWYQNFDLLDANGDGIASADELNSLKEKLKVKAIDPEVLSTPGGSQLVARMKVLDATSPKNMLEHLQLHWQKVGHPVLFKQNPDNQGEFLPQQYGLSKDDLRSYNPVD